MGQAEQLAAAIEALTNAANTFDTASDDTVIISRNAVTSGQGLQTNWKGRAPQAFLTSLDKLAGDSFDLAAAFTAGSTTMNTLALVIADNLETITKALRISQQVTVVPADVLAQNKAAEAAGQAALSDVLYAANLASQAFADIQYVGVCSTGFSSSYAQVMNSVSNGGGSAPAAGGGSSTSSGGGGGTTTGGGGGGGGTTGGSSDWGKIPRYILKNLFTGFLTAGIGDITNYESTGKWWSGQRLIATGIGSGLAWMLVDIPAVKALDNAGISNIMHIRVTKVIQAMIPAVGLITGLYGSSGSNTTQTPNPTITVPGPTVTVPGPTVTVTKPVPGPTETVYVKVPEPGKTVYVPVTPTPDAPPPTPSTAPSPSLSPTPTPSPTPSTTPSTTPTPTPSASSTPTPGMTP